MDTPYPSDRRNRRKPLIFMEIGARSRARVSLATKYTVVTGYTLEFAANEWYRRDRLGTGKTSVFEFERILSRCRIDAINARPSQVLGTPQDDLLKAEQNR